MERIKAVPYETKLLVLDPDADIYYRERDIMVSSSQSNVVFIKTPAAPRAKNESSDDDDDDDEVKLRSKGSRVCVALQYFLDKIVFFPEMKPRHHFVSTGNDKTRSSFAMQMTFQ